jgi:hypothetical protein
MGCGTERCLGSDDAAGYSSDNVAWSVTSASNRDVERNLNWRGLTGDDDRSGFDDAWTRNTFGAQQAGRIRFVRGHTVVERKTVRYLCYVHHFNR